MKAVFTLPEKTHGPGPVFFTWQKSSGNYLVTTGYDQTVNVYDRHGDRKDQISLPGMCTGLGYDKDGDTLGIITDRSARLFLWDANTQQLAQVDTGLRDVLTLLLWAKTGPFLAIGTSKGNLLIYHHRSCRKVPILGKHAKRITYGAWSQQNMLALVGEDNMLTVSNQEGDTLCQTTLKSEATLVQFSCMKKDERSTAENTVSLVLNKKTLLLLDIYDPENPYVLAFQEMYGKIIEYKWYGAGYVLLGFTNGYFVTISTSPKDIGQEMMQVRCHKQSLSHIAICLSQNKVASCSDNIIKVYDLSDLQDVQSVVTVDDVRKIEWLDWSDDGQFLGAGGAGGSLHVFLTKLPALGYSLGHRFAYLTSLTEVTVDSVTEPELHMTLRVDIEPSFIALGPFHLVVGMNNHAWFYALGDKSMVPLHDKEYLGTVKSMKLNGDYAAALFDGKLQLQLIEIENSDLEERESKLFPDSTHGHVKILCHTVTDDFLIYGTDTGFIEFFFLEDWTIINRYKHSSGIRQLHLDPSNTRLVALDDRSQGFVYNPVNDHVIDIANIPPAARGVFWDQHLDNRGCFAVFDDSNVYVYMYVSDTVVGAIVEAVRKISIPSGQHPLLLHDGSLTCQTQSGKTALLLVTGTEDKGNNSAAHQREVLTECLKLRRFNNAWQVCQRMNSKKEWTEFGNSALFNLDLDLAIRIFRQIGDVGMVWSLRELCEIEDKNLLAAYLALFKGDFGVAQELFLASSQPTAALQMRRDLLHWEQALQLAKRLAQQQIPFISREYAQQLELANDNTNALTYYETGITNDPEYIDHDKACRAGLARTSLRCGDIRKGVKVAKELNSRTLLRECAEILESMKQNQEAAPLYEQGNYYDKAANLYIKLKNWNKVGELLQHITSPKIYAQYAKAKEADGRYAEAAKAYEQAHDIESVVRIQLNNLNNLEEAVRLVKQTRSMEGAKLVAKFFQKLGDSVSAIQFLVLSKCTDEAFQLAKSCKLMDAYAAAIGDNGSPDDFNIIATYYEEERNNFDAGKFYLKAGQYKQAIKLLLKATTKDDDEPINLIVQAAAAAADDQTTRQVIEFLMGETDGVPKDFKHLFRLYMGLCQYKEAGKTAVVIAREEQNAGNYRNAHDVLLSMYQELRKQQIKVPAEMHHNLMLLHSYILVKVHIRHGNHMQAARLLERVANSISRFPAHTVPILTSAVVECQRAGLKNSAFTYASTLMRPEYRSQIDPKYRKKVEAIVRKPHREQEEADHSPCPFCNFSLAEMELLCSQCTANLPFCLATGKHIVKDDFTQCPSCHFPAIHTQFRELLAMETNCPMCLQPVSADQLQPGKFEPEVYEETEE
ncbi:WD repeat-containing protein 19 [Rhipicephalus sanguineus]|uniref:WD repeat-containing protein 19 n=1 Tax=Rhipicephalus sanguineus TaxID=34632 RepID=UPI0018938C8E|nr:WD repeat-containing protein 19 [Rhipicephalus sanguineus]